MRKDIKGFLYLSKLLNFKAYETFGFYDKKYELMQIKNKVLGIIQINEIKKLKDLLKEQKEVAISILNHLDFCTICPDNDTMLSLDKEYRRMLDYILFNQNYQIDTMQITSPFYKEVVLFNSFLLGREIEVNHSDYKTFNERGVRDFIGDKKDDNDQ